MVGSEMTEWQNYESFKAELDGELQKTAEGFVRIGYLLKVARDTNVLANSGYKSVAEFAEAEYNLDKTQVSRFIAINDRYSEGGYSDHLLPEWQGYGYAKLTIMMQIPETIAVELSPSYTKAEIQAIKEEVDEEKKVSDIEVALERSTTNLEDLNLIEKVLFVLMNEENEWKLFTKLWDKFQTGLDEYAVKAILAPSGEKVYSVKIPGTRRVMLILDDAKETFTVSNVRTGEKETGTWTDLLEAVYHMVDSEAETAGEAWTWIYNKPWPGDKVAPVQQEAPQQKKESKVRKAEKPKKTGTEAKPKQIKEPATAAVVETREAPTAAVMEEDGIPTTSFEEITEEKDGNDQSGMSDRAGDEADHGEPAGMEEVEASEDHGEDHGGDESDGEPEGEGSEGDPFGNERTFQMVDHVKDDVELLKQISAGYMWYYSQFDIFRAYKAALNLAADIEKLAKKQGWRLL